MRRRHGPDGACCRRHRARTGWLVTGSDEVNVVVARMARQIFHVPQVTARIYDPRKAEIYRRLGLATVAPVTWGIARMAESLAVREVNPVLSLASGAVEIVQVRVPPQLAGRTVGDIIVPGEIDVVGATAGRPSCLTKRRG
ncbi:MAG: NAD-binding protein [Caldilineaceae bacterium]